MLYNLPYRPDLNGIERVWSHLKAKYRCLKVACLCHGDSFDHKLLV